ncbi:MAG: rod shape-determining protein MreC [Pseudomonadota bacterium]
MSAPGVHRAHHGRLLGLRTFGCIVLCIILMFADQRTDALNTPRGWLMAVTYPLQTLASLPSTFFRWTDDASRSRAELARENMRLRRQQLLANARIQQLNAVRAENDRLRAMLDARPRAGDNVEVARLINVDSDPFRHRITLNKGTSNGVYERQAIIDASGVVGRILKVGPVTSQAMLISDPGHAIQVEVVRNGLRTVVFGIGEFDQLEIRFLPNNADIVVGDLLVTTSLGSDFPAGYPVGEITRFEPRPKQAFARVMVQPSAALTRMREVLLLQPRTNPSDGQSE